MIERTEHQVIVPNLPESLRGLKVVQLTDLHRSHLTSDILIRHAVAMANAEKPDLILLTGDYVTQDPADIIPCGHLIAPLRARLGVFAVLGNHDYTADAPSVVRMLKHSGITVLMNESVEAVEGLWLAGLEDDRHGRPNPGSAFAEIPANKAVIAMIHNPAFSEKIAELACVVLSGHTHGGQVKIPILTTRELRRIGAKHYRAGWYTVGNVLLYVNRGIGKVGVPFRFRCRPEIAVFNLTP